MDPALEALTGGERASAVPVVAFLAEGLIVSGTICAPERFSEHMREHVSDRVAGSDIPDADRAAAAIVARIPDTEHGEFLTLRDVAVGGIVRVPFLRLNVDSISAWWLTDRPEGSSAA